VRTIEFALRKRAILKPRAAQKSATPETAIGPSTPPEAPLEKRNFFVKNPAEPLILNHASQQSIADLRFLNPLEWRRHWKVAFQV
jgi:hypothetical protein